MTIKESLRILSAITFLCLPGEVICDGSQEHIDSTRLSDEAECRSNTRQIRDIMDVIKKQHNPSHDTLKKLTTLLEKNLYFFKKYNKDNNDDETIRGSLFGLTTDMVEVSSETREKNYEQHVKDYSDLYSVVSTLMSDIKAYGDEYSLATIVKMTTLLHPVVHNSAELSEYLSFDIVIDAVLASPLTMVKYLDKCSADEWELFFHELNFIYEASDQRKILDSALVKIGAQERKYSNVIKKIKNRMNEDCIKYEYGDYCKEQNTTWAE